MRRHKRRPERRPWPPTPQQPWFRRHRFSILIAVIATLVLVRCGFDFLLPSQTGMMHSRFARIEYGMTTHQVEGILGKPNYLDGDEIKIWTSGGGAITLEFKDGVVSKKEFLPLGRDWRPPRFGP